MQFVSLIVCYTFAAPLDKCISRRILSKSYIEYLVNPYYKHIILHDYLL